MACSILVTVRTASTRLPRKALLKINGTPFIKILIEQIKKSDGVKRVIICTTKEKSDDELVEYLRKNKIDVFRGDNQDILKRLYLATKKYKLSKFIVIEGDTLFCDSSIISNTCKKLTESDYDFIAWENLPFGVSPLGIKTNKLCKLVENKKTKDTENGWGKIITDSGFFKVGQLHPKNKRLNRPEIRLSIDYKEDFELARKIYESLSKKTPSLIDVIQLLDENQELLKINKYAQKKYEKNLEKNISKITMKKSKIHT
ncbi:MAG TPA: NTP transferase domain-containing protein [Verrucomicrobiae bacterium]|nr:NTP transferase domain-containing protein [Verrucomicrobiae bacterium]